MNKQGYRRRQIMILGFEWQIDALEHLKSMSLNRNWDFLKNFKKPGRLILKYTLSRLIGCGGKSMGFKVRNSDVQIQGPPLLSSETLDKFFF